MSLDWDPQGRMWVVETPEYPGGRDVNKNDFKAYWDRAKDPTRFPVGGKEPRKPRDRISILTDTNGDGVMDKKTVFADGLELPTSPGVVQGWRDRVAGPDILWIRDTNGDGTADKIETLYTGWGTFDTHAVINNLRWGPDGWVYGTVGYTRGKVKSGDGSRNFGDIAAGVPVSVRMVRCWNRSPLAAATPGDAKWRRTGRLCSRPRRCGEPICHVVIPEKGPRPRAGRRTEGLFEHHRGEQDLPAFDEKRQPYVQIDWVGAWTAAAGATIYDGGAWPGVGSGGSLFLLHGRGHPAAVPPRVPSIPGADLPGPQGRMDGSRPSSREHRLLVPSDPQPCGPDGALYVVDFYNQIAVHNDTRGPAHGARNAAARPDRDHHFTRLWRVQHKDAKALPPHTLNPANPAGLVDMLAHPNGWVRVTANRLSIETQPKTVAAPLTGMLKSSPSRYGRIEALYTLNNLGQLDDALLLAAPGPEGAVRKNAARVAAGASRGGYRGRPGLRGLLQDPDGRAKINALIALGSLPPTRENRGCHRRGLARLRDPWLESAAIGAAARDPLLSPGGVVVEGSRLPGGIRSAHCPTCGPAGEWRQGVPVRADAGSVLGPERWIEAGGLGQLYAEPEGGRDAGVHAGVEYRLAVSARLGTDCRLGAAVGGALGHGRASFGFRETRGDPRGSPVGECLPE